MENQNDNYLDNHFIHKSNWLRAAVLGANDGILSTSSLAIGVAAASEFREPIVLATLAGLYIVILINSFMQKYIIKLANMRIF